MAEKQVLYLMYSAGDENMRSSQHRYIRTNARRECMLRHKFAGKFVVCCAASFILIGTFSANVHAAGISSPKHKIKQGPPIQCLDVSISNVSGQETVSVSSPPGGGVEYSLVLYVVVTHVCPNNFLVTNIKIDSSVNISCPPPSIPGQPPDIILSVPYGLHPGGGYGNISTPNGPDVLIDRCIVFQNGKPTNSLIPNRITRSVSATGLTINNAVEQEVTSDTLGLLVWPA